MIASPQPIRRKSLVRGLLCLRAAWAPLSSISYRYAKVLAALLCTTILAFGSIQAVLSYREATRSVSQLQQAEARAAAAKIEEYLHAIERPLQYISRIPVSSDSVLQDDQAEEFRRLLRTLPAISDIRSIDRDGREQMRVSRTEIDRIGSGIMLPDVNVWVKGNSAPIFYSAAYFRDGYDPYTSVAIRGPGDASNVIVAELNLKFVADVVGAITVGREGRVYVVDATNHLLAHPSLRLLLQGPDLSASGQVLAVREALRSDATTALPTVWAKSPQGGPVMTSAVLIGSSNWLVFVEQPAREVLESVWATLYGTLALLALALIASLLASIVLARRLTAPILTLRHGAARIGAGDLGARLDIRTGDEVQALGDEFNRMAEKLREYTTGLEQKVAEKTAQLELANRHKSEFLANMSHELRTPLNAIIGFSEVLKKKMFGTLNAKQEQYAQYIHSSGEHLLSLINDILDLSKVEAGRMELEPVDFDVRRVLENALMLIRERARRGDVRVELHSHDDLAVLRADERKFKQVVVNLLSNAVKFTPPGGRVTVSASRLDSGVTIEVTDTGIGIAAGDLPRIFDEFQQIRSSGEIRHEGTGLGLSLARRLVELHGGRITVESEPGRGSTFRVWLPDIGWSLR
jgi:two-component system, NtrC family, sensor kinase